MADNISIRKGSIFDSKMQTIVRLISCDGAENGNIDRDYYQRYPYMQDEHKIYCENKRIAVGYLWLYRGEPLKPWVLNFPIRNDSSDDNEYENLKTGLQKFIDTYQGKGINSIAFPLISEDEKGLKGEEVKNIMLSYLSKCEIPVEIYDNAEEAGSADDGNAKTITAGKISLKQVGKIDLSQFERVKKELSKVKENYYIIDTNVFITHPDIISKMDVKYPIILSAKVVDELDKKKIDFKNKPEELANVEKAIRNLNRSIGAGKYTIISEHSDLSALPQDYNKKSPDNLILSIPLKYKNNGHNPIMLTADNGLQLKCKMNGIATLSPEEFLKKKR